jgi:hypothetical protein
LLTLAYTVQIHLRCFQAFFKEAYKTRMRGKNEPEERGRGSSGGPAGRNGGRTEAWLENLCQVRIALPRKPATCGM